MNLTWKLQRVAGICSATIILGTAGCASSRYDRSTGEVIDDRRLASRVESALDDQPVYKYPDVKVHTYRGVVQLSGFVATEAQKEAATEITKRVRGVGEVENNILLAPLERTAVRDYIPGREEESGERESSGAPARPSNATSGSITNSATTNTNVPATR